MVNSHKFLSLLWLNASLHTAFIGVLFYRKFIEKNRLRFRLWQFSLVSFSNMRYEYNRWFVKRIFCCGVINGGFLFLEFFNQLFVIYVRVIQASLAFYWNYTLLAINWFDIRSRPEIFFHLLSTDYTFEILDYTRALWILALIFYAFLGNFPCEKSLSTIAL